MGYYYDPLVLQRALRDFVPQIFVRFYSLYGDISTFVFRSFSPPRRIPYSARGNPFPVLQNGTMLTLNLSDIVNHQVPASVLPSKA